MADGSAVWGTAYEFFGGGEAGKEACRAIGALAAVGQIDATITNFLLPLQVSNYILAYDVCRHFFYLCENSLELNCFLS